MTSNFYEWWKNHRKVLTYGGFLILFAFYLSPLIKEAKYKNICIKLSEKGVLNKFTEDNIKVKLLEETGLTIEEFAQIEGYKNCIK